MGLVSKNGVGEEVEDAGNDNVSSGDDCDTSKGDPDKALGRFRSTFGNH